MLDGDDLTCWIYLPSLFEEVRQSEDFSGAPARQLQLQTAEQKTFCHFHLDTIVSVVSCCSLDLIEH